MEWEVSHHRGTVGELHGLEPDQPGRSVWMLETLAPSIALGSTQTAEVLDPSVGAGGRFEIARRPSGGGLVLMRPDDVAWIDVVIAATDPLWRDDVGESFQWLGEVWADALSDEGLPAQVHRGPAIRPDLGRIVCFAGVGSGEVLVAGRKIVGMSQRRTRDWARFQCLVYGRFVAAESMSVLAADLATEDLRVRLEDSVGAVDDPAATAGRFLERLGRVSRARPAGG